MQIDPTRRRSFRKRLTTPPARPVPLPGYRPRRRLPVGLASHIQPDRMPITLPPSVWRPITDDDLGMDHDEVAQEKTETFLRSVIAFGLKQEQRAREAARLAAARSLAPGPTIAVEVPDDALTLIDPTDKLDAMDREILAELRRITALSPPQWITAA